MSNTNSFNGVIGYAPTEFATPLIYQELNNNADGGASVDIINNIGYCIQQVPTTYIVQNAPVYIQVSVDDTVTAGSVGVYITYVNF